MKNTSRCGLGKTATNTIIAAMDKFQDYFAARMDKKFDGNHLEFDIGRAVADYEKYKS